MFEPDQEESSASDDSASASQEESSATDGGDSVRDWADDSGSEDSAADDSGYASDFSNAECWTYEQPASKQEEKRMLQLATERSCQDKPRLTEDTGEYYFSMLVSLLEQNKPDVAQFLIRETHNSRAEELAAWEREARSHWSASLK